MSDKKPASRMVYQNKSPPRSKAMQCQKCMWFVHLARGKGSRAQFQTMKRLYVKRQKRWCLIGWVCLYCGNVVLDDSYIAKRKAKSEVS